MLFEHDLDAGERVYAMPTIAGNDAYLMTTFGQIQGNLHDAGDEKGRVRRFNLSKGDFTAKKDLQSGAASVSLDHEGKVIAANVLGESRVDNNDRDEQSSLLNDLSVPIRIHAWLDHRVR